MRRLSLAVFVTLAAWIVPHASAEPAPRGSCNDGRVHLAVFPARDDGYITLSRQYSREGSWKKIRTANRNRAVQVGRAVRIPLELLPPERRLNALTTLFPEDAYSDGHWHHRVGQKQAGSCREHWEDVSTWFTGDAHLAGDLRRLNGGRAKGQPASGQRLSIPREMLLPVFVSEEEEPELAFGSDETGPYAEYRLRSGEALYSSVVVRFTGLLDAEEVNQVASEIARRSNIQNVRSIPIGYTIRIPRHLLLPRYLPPDDPVRMAYEAGLLETSRVRPSAGASRLRGVYVILDAGHGGVDVGTTKSGMDEDEYVYDIMCRMKRRLQRDTDAMVLVTIEDRKAGFAVRDQEKLPRDRHEVIRTTPPYQPVDPDQRAMGVNLRWYLVNSFYRRLRERGVDPDRVVFASLHADSLHPSMRGAMVYIPGGKYRTKRYGHGGAAYARYEEVREETFISFDRKTRIQSEGLARRLAGDLLDAFHAHDIPVHRYEPVRDHIIRRKRSWLPAVIRCSEVPASLLLEVVNLNNKADRARLRDPEFRERLAAAFVDALLVYYKAGATGGATAVASSSE